MAHDSGSDSWDAKFLDYLGLGLTLTGTDILVREAAITLAVALYVFGAVILAAGLNWSRVKPYLSGRLAMTVGTVGNDFRYWLLVLAFLVFAARGVSVF